MPTMSLFGALGTSVQNALRFVTAMDYYAIQPGSTATQITLSDGFTNFILTGTGFTVTIINGVQYIDSGTVDAITVDQGAGLLYAYTDLAMSGATLRNAMRADIEGTNQQALENLFRGLTWTINADVGPDGHGPAPSVEGQSLVLTRGNTYNMGFGDDVVLAAGSGNDTIDGFWGHDSLMGNGGNDTIYGGADNDTILGGTGIDGLYGGSGIDSLEGGDGDDYLDRGELSFGGKGNDVVFTEGGQAYGGDGNDIVSNVDFFNSTLLGDAGNDTLTGYYLNDLLYGGDGNDVLDGGSTGFSSFIDTLFGGNGNDVLTLQGLGYAYGDAGNDTIMGTNLACNLFGGAGNDSITGTYEIDQLVGGIGNDRLFAGNANDTLVGEEGNDSLDGGIGGDSLFGDEGNDTLLGWEDGDGLYGGEGNDVLAGGTGGDTLDGGEGIDTASYADSGAGVGILLATGFVLGGDAVGDTLIGIENVTGSGLDDTLVGDNSANLLSGGAGLDTLEGWGGNDTLNGGFDDDSLNGGSGADSLIGATGNDILIGGSGADTLVGGAGIDVMTGDTGADVFLFLAVTETGSGTRDQITDFVSGVDVVSFAGLGLTLVTGAFTGANQIRYLSSQSYLQIDVNGDGVSDRQVELTGVGVNFVAATDLILV